MPIGAAILGGGAIGAAAQIYGANKAASTQTQLGQASLQQQRQMFDIAQGNAQPFIDFSKGILPSLQGLMTPGAATPTLEQLPGYKFSLSQGQRAVTNALSTMGLGTSGPLARGLDEYTTGFAAKDTFFPYLAALQGGASLGAQASGTLGNQAVSTGASMGNTLSGIGNAQAAATMSQANAISSLGASVPQALLLSRLLGGGGGGPPNALDTMSTNYLNSYQPTNLGPQLGPWNPFG